LAKTLEYYASLDYPVVVRRIPDDLGCGYEASMPCLGAQSFVGCGDSPQEAYDNLQVARGEIFAEYLDEGISIPEPPSQEEYEDYSGKFNVRMPRELHARVAASAERNGVSLNQYVVYALTTFDSQSSLVDTLKEIVGTPSGGLHASLKHVAGSRGRARLGARKHSP
jgi:antitoxin HicB